MIQFVWQNKKKISSFTILVLCNFLLKSSQILPKINTSLPFTALEKTISLINQNVEMDFR